MRAWQLDHPGGNFSYNEVAVPTVRPGTVLVRISAAPLLTYFKHYVEGTLPPIYVYPKQPFTPGTDAVGIVERVGEGVWHLRPGQRVALSSHLVAEENVDEPEQILMGWTAISPGSLPMQAAWPDGTLAEYALAPAAATTPLDGLDHLDDARLASLGKFAVPYGGLLRGRLAAGETLVVIGATGWYGSAAVMLGLAMGAARVVATGRNREALEVLARIGGDRVRTVALSGDMGTDAAGIREAAGGGAHLVYDMLGDATDPGATLSGLRALRRGGRLVLMGSMTVPLPLNYVELMVNNWEVIGNFMFPRDAFLKLAALVRGGLLDLEKVPLSRYPLAELTAAMDMAARLRGLETVVVTTG
jgi:alcohol dehydrogenase